MTATLRAMPDPVRLEAVGLRYGDVRALADVTLDMPAGRIVGLIGPDGVGKSNRRTWNVSYFHVAASLTGAPCRFASEV